MSNVFSPNANTIAQLTIYGGICAVSAIAIGAMVWVRSPWNTAEGRPIDQPVPFSHLHHVTDDGIDCRYCHTSVETSSFAGIPPTQTCMNCHSQIWTQSPMLQPVRDSFQSGQPLHWNRVNALPDYVYFDHSIHVAKGVGCSTCHGQVDQMPLMARGASLQMGWCLECHRDPQRYVRPPEEVFNMQWTPPADQEEQGRKLMEIYHITSQTSCTTCHR